MGYSVRLAAASDCRELAEVQVASYRAAYAGAFPPAYLDLFSIDEQERDWLDWLHKNADDVLLVAVDEAGRVLGYVLAQAAPEIRPGYDAEIMALHVRREQQGQGVGGALLRAAATALQGCGSRSVMLWTLAGNPVRCWYERLGGRLIAEKSYLVDDWEVVEVGYGWPDVAALCGEVGASRGQGGLDDRAGEE